MWPFLLLVALLFFGASALDCSATTPLQQVAPQGGTVQRLGSCWRRAGLGAKMARNRWGTWPKTKKAMDRYQQIPMKMVRTWRFKQYTFGFSQHQWVLPCFTKFATHTHRQLSRGWTSKLWCFHIGRGMNIKGMMVMMVHVVDQQNWKHTRLYH